MSDDWMQDNQQDNKSNWKKNWKPKKEEGPFELYKPGLIYVNQDVPDSVVLTIKEVIEVLNKEAYTIRTLGETQTDDMIETLATRKEVYIPWKEFNNKETKFSFSTEKSIAIAKSLVDPAKFDAMKPSAQKFRSRNVRAMLGDKINSPVMFALVWSEDGAEISKERTVKSATVGNLIVIAEAMRIPVFNLAKEDSVTRLKNYLGIQNG